MESWMDTEGCWKLEAHCRWVDNLVNFKGSHESGGQLTGVHLQGKVPGGEPDLLPGTVGGSGDAVLVGQSSIPLGRTGQGSPGMPPNSMAAAQVGTDRGDSNLLLLGGEQRGLVPICDHEGRHASGRGSQSVMGVLDPW